MAQVLSQDEVDALLNAVNDGGDDDFLGGGGGFDTRKNIPPPKCA